MAQNRIRIEQGQVAPFTGQLLSDEAVGKLLANHKKEVKLLKIEMEAQQKLNEAERTALVDSYEAKLTAERAKRMKLQEYTDNTAAVYSKSIKRLSESMETKWYQSPYLHNVLGILIGGSICIGIDRAIR